jgi:hypothetical protein
MKIESSLALPNVCSLCGWTPTFLSLLTKTQLMKPCGCSSGFSLSKELSSLAEFRLYATQKLQLIEKLISGSDSSVGVDPARASQMDPTKRYGFDHDPEITRSCLQLLITSERPLTIGQICADLQSNSSPIPWGNDPLSLVSKSLHQLVNLTLAVPVERDGIRKWTWTGNDIVGNGTWHPEQERELTRKRSATVNL